MTFKKTVSMFGFFPSFSSSDPSDESLDAELSLPLAEDEELNTHRDKSFMLTIGYPGVFPTHYAFRTSSRAKPKTHFMRA